MASLAMAGTLIALAHGASARPDDQRPSSEAAAQDRPAPPPAVSVDADPGPPAQLAPVPPAVAELATAAPAHSGLRVHDIAIHGFVSEGGFLSTSNDYIGSSAHGSLKLFEAGINVSTEVTDRLRVGVQLFARDFGALEDPPRIDWAFLDYRWRAWFGLRAGIVKMPFGLYNEYADIDSGRLPLLMPPSVYPFRNRDVLLAQRGFAAYGDLALGGGGELEYQLWLGTLSIPLNALDVAGATLNTIDTRYVAGVQAFWHPPLDGLRVGGTAVRTSIDFDLTLSPQNTSALIMAGVVPPDYNGAIVISQRPDTWLIASAEYLRNDWLFAAEYSRTLKRQRSSLPRVSPTFEEDNERFYGMTSYRTSARLELGGYYSVYNLDANDRGGHAARYAERFYAFQRDLAATVRVDINDHWLWKLEAHFMDGTADLPPAGNPHPDRYWGLFMFRTTVTF
jgi:hypothetical protein